MKKINYLLFIAFLFFININIVFADCDKNACATCIYKNGSWFSSWPDIVYEISSDGKNISVSSHQDYENKSFNVTYINQVADTIFIDKSTNKIKCPSTLYSKMTSVGNNKYTEYTIYSDSKKGDAVKLQDKSKNNNKKITSTSTSTKVLSCQYKGSTNGGILPAPTATVDTDGDKKMDVKFSAIEWSFDESKSDITASSFKDAVSKNKCPTFYLTCSTDNDGLRAKCTLTKNKITTSVGGNNSTEGNTNTFVPVKPGIKVDIDLSGNGCGVLSKDLTEWLQWLLDVIRIGGLVLSVVLGISDYLRASFSSSEDGMSKANKNFSTRLFSLGLLFLVPTLVEFLLTLLNIGVTAKNPTCGLK